jgi:hypothetical protein
MKTDDDSGEAEEPPEEPPSSEGSARTSECEGNEELQWARRHVPQGSCGPCLVFRKTELHDRPPGSRSYRAATSPGTDRSDQVAKELARQIAALNDRLDAFEDRMDRAIDQLDRRFLMHGHQGVS